MITVKPDLLLGCRFTLKELGSDFAATGLLNAWASINGSLELRCAAIRDLV